MKHDVAARPRVLCIGLDGATFDLLDPMIRRGWLPNIRALIERGVRGVLRSTVPVLSGPAWVTFMTGKNPGKHGIFSFGVRRQNYLDRMFRTTMLEDVTFWELVDQSGGTSVVLNVPMTYPPHAIRGAVVTGLLTPGTKSDYTHPPELKAEIAARWPEYRIDVDLVGNENDPTRFLLALLENTHRRGELALHLLSREPWRLAVVCFVGTDRIQHLLYPRIASPETAEAAVAEGIEAYYRAVDSYVGKMLAEASDATTFLLSDHGFTTCDANFLANEWLAHRGYLRKRARASRGAVSTAVRMAKRMGLSYERVRGLGRAIGMRDVSEKAAERFSPFVRSIDWSATRAFYGSTDGISLNLKGREPQGIVDASDYERVREKIIAELAALRHADGGGPLLRNVFRREELYSGPHLDDAPDILLEAERCKIVGDLLPAGSDSSRFLEPPSVWSGVHHRDGVLVAAGPGVAAGRRLPASDLADVAPTMLCALDLAIPEDMDGRVVDGLFTEDHLRAHPPRRSGSSRRDGGSPTHVSDEDQEKLEEQLRSLGYL